MIKLYQVADAVDLQAGVQESVPEVGWWMGWCHSQSSLEDARQWILAQQECVAVAAARQVADHVFRETDLNRLEIVCAVGNILSQRRQAAIGRARIIGQVGALGRPFSRRCAAPDR